MPPKIDPYATRGARVFDLILILCALVAILLVIWTAPPSHATSDAAGKNPTTATEIGSR
jgi:hypothetical protein